MKNGFSVVELVIVLTLLAIFGSVATLNFHQFARKSEIESQVKMLHADLMALRARSLFEKQSHAAKITPTLFTTYSSSVVTGVPQTKRTLTYPVTNASQKIIFNEMGLAEFSNCSICVGSDSPAALDSIVVFTTRIQMGKRKPGSSCNSEYITTY